MTTPPPVIASDLAQDPQPQPIARARKISARTKRALAGLAVFALVAIGYVAYFGQCEPPSKFCTLGVVGTRSDIGFEWDTVTLYVTTYPDGVTVVGSWPW